MVIEFEAYDRLLDPRFDPNLPSNFRNGTCYHMDEFLTFDDCPGNPATYNCSIPQLVEFENGKNFTLWAPPVGDAPMEVSVSCPGKQPECTFWDENASAWAGNNCTVVNYTAWNVTCACTHLTDFAGAASDVGSTAAAVVATGLDMNLSDLLKALLVLLTLMVTLALFGLFPLNL